MFTMYDSVDTDVIPREPHAVAAYINGEYANYDKAKELFPHARILRISVTGDVAADCYDVETGDYVSTDVPRLYKVAVDAGIWRPCFYAQLSGVMPAVKVQLNTIEGMAREKVRLWVAYYDGSSALPAGYDAHQFTEKALGRNLDESICADTFFQAAPKPAPEPVKPTPEPVPVPDEFAYFAGALNKSTGEWYIKGTPNGSK